MMKVKIDKAKIYVTARFHAEGSVLRETIRSGGVGVDMRSEITSSESAERVAALVRNAEQGCYIMQTIMNPTPVTRQFTLNGAPFDPESFKKP
jgi:organic hydroperoxide reductase OsmC/OhrA